MSAEDFDSAIFRTLLAALDARQFKLAIAESLTGGLVSSNIVSIEGASKVFLGSIVSYQDSVKHSMLDVSSEILESRGAVSAEAATAMAAGVRKLFANNTGVAIEAIASISTTGMASPAVADAAGGKGAKPHGLVFVAAQIPGRVVEVLELNLAGDRNEIRKKAAIESATLVLRLLRS